MSGGVITVPCPFAMLCFRGGGTKLPLKPIVRVRDLKGRGAVRSSEESLLIRKGLHRYHYGTNFPEGSTLNVESWGKAPSTNSSKLYKTLHVMLVSAIIPERLEFCVVGIL